MFRIYSNFFLRNKKALTPLGISSIWNFLGTCSLRGQAAHLRLEEVSGLASSEEEESVVQKGWITLFGGRNEAGDVNIAGSWR